MTPASPRLGHKLLSGISANLLGQGVVLLAVFLLTPLVVEGLGTASYGLYALLWTLLNYALVLSAGIVPAVQKYAAELLGRGEKDRLSALLRRALAAHMAGAAAAAGLLWLGRGWMAAEWLALPADIHESGYWALSCAAAAAPFFFAAHFASGLLYGAQRFRLHAAYATAQNALPPAAAAAALSLGGDLADVASAFLVVQALLSAAGLWLVSGLLLEPAAAPSREEERGFVRFSLKSLFTHLLWTVNYQGDRYFIGALLPLSDLGFYMIASGLAQRFTSLCGAISTIAFPVLAELHGRKELERHRRLYLKVSELTLFVLLPLAILAFVLAPQFLTLWLGEEFSAAGTWPCRLLVLANLFLVLTYLPKAVAAGNGHPELEGYAAAARAAVLLLLWPRLIPAWGILGAAAGMLCAEALVGPLFVWRVHKRFLGLGWREFWTEGCWRPAAAALGLCAFGLAVHARVSGWLELLAVAGSGAALFAALGYRLIDDDGRRLLGSWLRGRA